jgi:hypothetical protein
MSDETEREKQKELALAEARMLAASGKNLHEMIGGDAPTLGQKILASAPGRFGVGMASPVEGGAQALAHGASWLGGFLPRWAQTGLADKAATGVDGLLAAQTEAMRRAREATDTTGSDIAGGLGNVTTSALATYLAPELKLAKAKGNVPAPLWKRAASGAVTGGGLGVLEPVTNKELPYATQKAEQVGFGMLGGAGAPVVGAGLGKVFAPTVSADVRALLDRGIRLTPGQIAGGGWKALEDKLASVPVAGSFIRSAQGRSVDDFNRAIANDALAHIGTALPSNVRTGRGTVDYTARRIGDVYNSVLPKMRGQLDAPLMMDFSDAISRAKAQAAGDDAINRLQRVLEEQFTKRSTTAGGHFDGDTLKLIQSDLTKIGKRYSSSDDPDHQLVGDAVMEMHDAFNNMLTRVNPQYADTLNGANAAWAKYVRLRAAASRVGAKEGKVTPAQFAGAVKANDASVGDGAYARGNALMQRTLSDPALNVLPQVYPDSGTAGRLGLLGLLGASSAVPGLTAPAAIAAGGLSALYTRPGQAVARGLMTHAPWNRLGNLAVRGGNVASSPSAALLAAPSAIPIEEGSD